MKIRNGFVSNSSSTSFCIFGTQFDDKYINFLTDERFLVSLVANNLKIKKHKNQRTYIGRDVEYIDNVEKVQDFKYSVANSINNSFNKFSLARISPRQCGWIIGPY
jgi:hypothetical protein